MLNNKELLAKLKELNDLKIEFNKRLSKYTSFKIGGPAQIFITPYKLEVLQKLLALVNKEKTFILGAGSNIIVSDSGYQGIVIYTGQLNKITINNNLITAQAGALLSDVTEIATKASLTGLEFASGIPGSIGGALYMNAGAYGGEIKEIISSAELINYQGEKRVLKKDELNLAYRNSILHEKDLVATEITLKLRRGKQEEIQAKIDELKDKRWSKQPMNWPSAGSIFKRKKGTYPGKLIEAAGLKGFSVNDAQISTKHAGFIINKGNATAKDVKELIKLVQQKVATDSGITLEVEPRFL